MSSILELMKRNAVPAAVMRTASKGALPIPAEQMLEVLVYLTANPVFAQDARMTLASWDLSVTTQVVANPNAAPDVLGYYWSPANRRPALMPALIENPAIAETLVMELAAEAPREIVAMLLASPRVRNSPAIVEALTTNIHVVPQDIAALTGEGSMEMHAEPASQPSEHPAVEIQAQQPPAQDAASEAVRQAFEKQHAAEIAAEEGKSFELVEAAQENGPAESEALPEAGVENPCEPESHVSASLAAAALRAQAAAPGRASGDATKPTLLQKIAKLTASERVKTAFIGSREERAVLIRDGARVVQNAVLSSPKLTEPEVEVFAAAKNVHENVLREIARSRRFMKNYAVVRNLVMNPKTPLDISMPLVKMLMVFDLKQLQRSHSVSETIRKLATRYYREKAMSGGKTKD